MQEKGRITITDGPGDPIISQTTLDDAHWLAHITLDPSDYTNSSPNFNPKPSPYCGLADEDAALNAHLWDPEHASDLDQYEWDSDDLVSSACSDDSNDLNSLNEESPRLARKDEFEKGICREWTRTREYREQWEEDHIFYKRKIQARLEAVGNEDDREHEERSCVSEGAWSGQVDQLDWGTPATSGVADWSGGSEDAWTAEDGRVEGKREDEESWTRSDNSQTQEMDIVDDREPAGTDEDPGESCVSKHIPGREFGSTKNIAHNSPNSASAIRPFHKSTPISPTTTTTSSSTIHKKLNTRTLINNNDHTTLSHPPPASQTATNTFRNPPRTPRFLDPEPTIVELALSSTLNDGQVLDTFLDTCIAKTRVLLAEANEALNSVADVGEISALENAVLGEEEQTYAHGGKVTASRPGPRIGFPQMVVSKKCKPIAPSPAEIVRVDRWWKVKGDEAWREVGGWADENVYVQ